MRRFNPERELYKIQHGNRNKLFIGAFLILLIISISSTYALYQVRYSKRIIYTKVAPFSSHDLDLAIYVDGSKVEKVPEKGKGYYYESITCESDPSAIAGWDYTNWKLGAISVTIPNKCNINFTSQMPLTLIEQIEYVKGTSNNMVIEEKTTEYNLRYIGKNPDNYIWFNCDSYDGLTQSTAAIMCEKWRIIGSFNHIPKSTGDTENLVKIIKADSIGTLEWDSANKNNWSTASLQKSLNGTYYNGTQLSNGKGITQPTRNMIEEVTWNIGGGPSTYTGTTTSQFYTAERGTATYGSQPSVWNGRIALMYPSDYGYATSGGSTKDRNACLEQALYNWSSSSYKTDCAENDWLLDTVSRQWTLTMHADHYTAVFYMNVNGIITAGVGSSESYSVRPTLFLNSNTKVVSGNGSSETPYILIP